ncbi:unnamed protein product [Vitrella brassicaformis CCMP3155]|uniref:Uncharacterized protein n=2 Tax=Vitrella brassicaformis TaxID=1169539 RepID=A0A0G4EY54_VITBC|nr:unnamed protein product [Vitrella brassicaformis CCMP3155]|eukprot:CEM03360.1 unnamed protein product [Vitrella brassicaformis CCMP3155]
MQDGTHRHGSRASRHVDAAENGQPEGESVPLHQYRIAVQRGDDLRELVEEQQAELSRLHQQLSFQSKVLLTLRNSTERRSVDVQRFREQGEALRTMERRTETLEAALSDRDAELERGLRENTRLKHELDECYRYLHLKDEQISRLLKLSMDSNRTDPSTANSQPPYLPSKGTLLRGPSRVGNDSLPPRTSLQAGPPIAAGQQPVLTLPLDASDFDLDGPQRAT